MLKPLLVLVAAGLTVWAVLDLAQTPRDRVRGQSKALWALAAIALPVLGPLAWLTMGRTTPAGGGRAAPPRPVGPDDDPDFLRRLDDERRRQSPDDAS
ncbi:MAG: PLDc N-terminal domain-containing protein [Actinomycetia bacterium]|nr:PLDc N-terminal domain-containing protein [Actinomycetes bacterium]